MPDLSNCEKDEFGNAYVYDRETGEVFGVRLEKVPIKTIPQEILVKFLKKESRRGEV